MIDKKTVFILGAGASCPYGYPSGAQLRKEICLDFHSQYLSHLCATESNTHTRNDKLENIEYFTKTFFNSSTKSIDLFLARNPQLAETGKYIIAFKVFDAEKKSHFREQSVQEQDWYSYLFDRLTDGIIDRNTLPEFSRNNVSFITFNYDRSLEHFLYESLRNSFTEVPDHEIKKEFVKIKIIHVYGQIAPLKWQDSTEGIGYSPNFSDTVFNV